MKPIPIFLLALLLFAGYASAQADEMVAVRRMQPIDCCYTYASPNATDENTCCEYAADATSCYSCMASAKRSYYNTQQIDYGRYNYNAFDISSVLKYVAYGLLAIFAMSLLAYFADGIVKAINGKGFLSPTVSFVMMAISYIAVEILVVSSLAQLKNFWLTLFVAVFFISIALLLTDGVVRLINKKGYLGKTIRVICLLTIAGMVLAFFSLILG